MRHFKWLVILGFSVCSVFLYWVSRADDLKVLNTALAHGADSIVVTDEDIVRRASYGLRDPVVYFELNSTAIKKEDMWSNLQTSLKALEHVDSVGVRNGLIPKPEWWPQVFLAEMAFDLPEASQSLFLGLHENGVYIAVAKR